MVSFKKRTGWGMGQIAETGSDIVAASSALAGLILVYIGALSSGFGSFQPQERKAVVGSHQRRVWFAFVGLILLLASLLLALVGKWQTLPCATIGAMALLFLGVVWVTITAALSAAEVR